MQASFQPKRLQQARFLKRKSLADLGADTDISRQALSQFERGDRTPLPETVANLSKALGVPVEFFLRPIGRLEGGARTLVHYRSLKRTRDIIKEQQRSSAILDICAALVDTLENHVEYQPANVPVISTSTNPLLLTLDDVEEVAADTRKRMGLGEGPIADMALLIENLSVPIIHTPLPAGMDGMSAWYLDRPLIVVSSECAYARSRLNVAHEFGHLVLHHDIEEPELDDETFRIVESQAWRFAGAFMLPAKTFLSEIYSVSLDALLILKKKWGVSVAAMVRRLMDLGVIDDAQRKNLSIQMRAKGWSKKEPGDETPRERGRLLNRAAIFLAETGEVSIDQLAEEARLPLQFIADALEVDVADLLPPPPRTSFTSS
jgi:Zn-dependent peptidase ImmA (M78 family)/transcriptional regulator with XRE-family HTH domain